MKNEPFEPFNFNQKYLLCQIGHPKHLDTLVHDKNIHVRCNVVRYGNDKHRDQLVHDEDPNVRWSVADNGNENHARALLNDEDPVVKQAARARLNRLAKFKNP